VATEQNILLSPVMANQSFTDRQVIKQITKDLQKLSNTVISGGGGGGSSDITVSNTNSIDLTKTGENLTGEVRQPWVLRFVSLRI
jgi:ABC-type polar amino acid transport system ATPase subunit